MSTQGRTRVALDTSALMMPVELDVRLFDELERLLGGARRTPEEASGDQPRTEGYEAITPQAVLEELRRLSEKGGREGTAANVGRDLATERCLVVDTEASYADDALVELAREGNVDYVVTNDRPLRDRVLEANVPVIALRGRNKLAITQP
ncbi:twitching motility protein PilT [Halobiforma lacisalsi AJ5]|uniref:Nucleotide binding protein PINc n=1 Tax=Natronobacterium lacisalsi AJ5 TaxID=358396 RepID=M0LV93_NATLA|nr:PIN domain-containing protein [Halobiforma lacisalsi]APW97551.1 twitching motility protein PilT [Halobiforma lacisalsi AJ5]EMA37068.1 nucleotide binding protein PINc [Halobiforma lacisalsi AJ5]